MRICIVSLNALPALSEQHKHLYMGGAEVQLAQLAMALARQGHEVSVIVHDEKQTDGAVYEGVRTIKAFRPHAGLPFVRFVHPRWTGLWSAASRAGADVYLYSCSGMLLGLLAMFCRLKGKRLVYRVASDADCDLRTALVKSARDRWLYHYGLVRSDAVLVQSTSQQQMIEKNFGKNSIIVRGLIERPRSEAAGKAKDVDVLWIANLRPVKRPELFLELARLAPSLRFHMAGGAVPGEEKYYRQIEDEARHVPNLTFHGKVPFMDIGGLFDRTRLFANTSEVEGFPNTFLQAWVRGIPVVTTFDPDGMVAREALGTTHADVRDMARSIDSLLQSPEAYAVKRSASLRHMGKLFDENDVLRPYLSALGGIAQASEAVGALRRATGRE